MKKFRTAIQSKQILTQLNCRSVLIHQRPLDNVAELDEAVDSSVCFYENPSFLNHLKSSRAGLIFVPEDFDKTVKPETNLIFTDKPYITFMMMVKFWLAMDNRSRGNKIPESTVIAGSAEIASGVKFGVNVLIGEGVKIAKGSCIDANTVVGENVVIGSNCHLFPNVTIYEDCRLGNNVIIHSGTVIGSDGFGYLLHEGIQQKIPQVGNVIVEDDVEIGSNSSIDRATLGSTFIGQGTKIDNLVQIGHNCKIGRNTIICAQVGLAGSTIVGDSVYLAGQVGVAGHLEIGNGAMIGAQSGVSGNVPEKAKYFGYPAIDAGLRKRIMASEKKLPDLVRAFKKNQKNRKKNEGSKEDN